MSGFSDSWVRGARAAAKPRKVFDSGKSAVPGLFVLITPAGSKLWRLRYWHGGKEKLLAVGRFPEMTVEAARKRARDARTNLTKGTDPVEAKREIKAARARGAASRFDAMAERWLENGAWTAATHKQYRRMVERDLLPAFGKMEVDAITMQDVNRVMAQAARKRSSRDVTGRRKIVGGVIAARTLRLVLAGVLDLAVDDGKLGTNPAIQRRSRTRTKRKTETHRPTSYRHLSADGLAAFLRGLDTYQGSPETTAALRLLVLCFTRPSELRCAHWSEFNLDAIGGAIWNIPAERMKAREPHDVPLSRQATEILRELHKSTGHGALLFPNSRDAQKPMGTSTPLRALEYLGVNGSPHGFRHSASTLLHEHGFDSLVVERQLAHADRNAVRRSYNKATFITERRRMLQHWADFLDGLKSGTSASNVLPMAGRRSS